MYVFSKKKFLHDRDMKHNPNLKFYDWYNRADGFECVPDEREEGYFRCVEEGYEYMKFSKDWVKEVHKRLPLNEFKTLVNNWVMLTFKRGY